MSNSNLEVSKANRANEMSELNDLTKFRLDKLNKIKDYLNFEIKERKDIIKKISKYIVVFDYPTNFLLHYLHRLALKYCVTCDNRWNTCRNSWSIFNFNIYRNDWCS